MQKTQFAYHDSNGNTITIKPNDEWVNYGDVNPLYHGGMFIRWENGMWHIIETRHGMDLPNGYCSDSEVAIWHHYAEPMDLFQGGDPDNGPTDYLKNEIESLSRVSGYENALVDFEIEYFLHGFGQRTRQSKEKIVSENNYWNTLSDSGIPIDKFK
jgi:hypothetical protein